jgi:hypothetical protein
VPDECDRLARLRHPRDLVEDEPRRSIGVRKADLAELDKSPGTSDEVPNFGHAVNIGNPVDFLVDYRRRDARLLNADREDRE